MGLYSSGSGSPSYRSLMIFIDGEYLRNLLKKLVSHNKINFMSLNNVLTREVLRYTRGEGHIHPELIRVYYYDAIVASTEPEYKEQKEYFDAIRKIPRYEVRLGRLICTKKNEFRQKGVDILLAVDMLTKAYLDHFEIALLIAGDDDFVDLVKNVKDVGGKRIFGAYSSKNASERLIDCFDERIELTDKILKEIQITQV